MLNPVSAHIFTQNFTFLFETRLNTHVLQLTTTESQVNVDSHVIQRKFHSDCSSVLCHFRRNEIIIFKLPLVNCFCLSLLSYCLGELISLIKQLRVCWNDIYNYICLYRKILGFYWWESVMELLLLCYLGGLLFDYNYHLRSSTSWVLRTVWVPYMATRIYCNTSYLLNLWWRNFMPAR